MICKYCKNDIPDNSLFCMYCGEKLAKSKKKSDEIKIPAPEKRGDKWRIRLIKEGVSATFDTPQECEAWARSVRLGFIKAQKNAPLKTKLFQDALDEYVELNKNVFSPATIREYTRSRDNELGPLLDKNIYTLTDADMQKFVNDFSADHAPKTTIDIYHRAMKVIRSVDKGIRFDVNLPQKSKPDVTVPDDASVKAIYAALKGSKMEIPFLLASAGSLRRGEIAALRKDDIRQGGVYVRRDMVLSSDEWVIKDKPKTSDSVRFAPLPAFVMEKLNAVEGDRICNMNPNTITSNFNRFLKRHDLPRISFHSLRHYWASKAHTVMPDSYLLAAGGWSTMDTPRKVYIKVQEDETVKLSAEINSIFDQVFDQKNEPTAAQSV